MTLTGLYLLSAEAAVNHGGISGIINTILKSNVLNLLLVIAFLVWIAKKQKLFSAFEKKQLQIKHKIENSEREKHNSEREIKNIETKLSKSDDEVLQIKKDGEDLANALSGKIIEEANSQVRDLSAKTEKIIEADKNSALYEIEKNISDYSFKTAEEHIKNSMNEETHKKYIEDFLKDIENLEDIKR